MSGNVIPLRGAEAVPFDAPVPAEPPPPPSGDGDDGSGPRGRGKGPQPPQFGAVVPLGTRIKNGSKHFVFLDVGGEEITLSPRDMHAVPLLSALFGGAKAKPWLAERWPAMRPKRDQQGRMVRDEDGELVMVRTGDFSARALGDALMQACQERGPADAMQHRRDGVWPGRDGGLVLHCGDRIWTHPERQEHAPGWVDGNAIHIAAPPRFSAAEIRAMAEPATATECQALIERLSLWSFAAAQEKAAPALLAGTIAVGIYAGALTRWRPHTWLRGPSNAGKSTLLDFIVAATGADPRSKDVSEAYVRSAFDSRATLIVLDEQEPDLAGVTAVLRLMRGASDGEGARTGRIRDGAAHTFRVACPFVLGAISTPAFEAADASRITTIVLRRPGGGDRQAALDAAKAAARKLHPRLFVRLVQGWERFQANISAYRGALMGRQATSRCADQLATQLAGWRTLISDEPADAWLAAEDLNMLDLTVITPDAAEETDAPNQVLAHLLASRVPVGDGRESMTIAGLLESLRDAVASWLEVKGSSDPGVEAVRKDCERWVTRAGALQVRWMPGEGAIFGNTSPLINRAFDGTPWANKVWQQALRDLPGARDAGSLKFRHGGQARAVLIPEAVLGLMPPRPRYGGDDA